MGATAAQSVFGKITPINKNRGRMIELDDGIKALVTVRPSYLLRLPDADAKAREYRRLVDDLKIARHAIAKIGKRGARIETDYPSFRLGVAERIYRRYPWATL
jgi:hypothetical protein